MSSVWMSVSHLGSIHICDLLSVNYWLNYLLNSGLYCIKFTHLHLLFRRILYGLKCLILGYVPIFQNV